MRVLLDTGILLRLVNRSSVEHLDVIASVQELRRRGEELVTTPQNLVEFWNVSTRPAQARGGFGRSTAEAERCLHFFEGLGKVLPEQPAIHAEWKRLVALLGVSGKAVHDARIAAQMLVAGVSDLLTLNADDFRRYAEIKTWTPRDFLDGRFP
ncbi:MAG TPA: type II toxin-antitoxin system VapC family toxin [Pirellulales bacterium]|jgi:predicted nucleic acid-binding protein